MRNVIVLDTETTYLNGTEVNPKNALVYDIGWVVCDRMGNVVKSFSYVVEEIWKDTEKMNKAFFSNKIPQYQKDIENGSRIVKPLAYIRTVLFNCMQKYGVKEIFAHNARFDYGALNSTSNYISNGKYPFFFPYGQIICDTMKMARSVVEKTPTYQKFCHNNGLTYKVRNTDKVRLTAEALYRYITKNTSFKEEHTGLADVMIEKEIMAYCFRKHKKMDRVLYPKMA